MNPRRACGIPYHSGEREIGSPAARPRELQKKTPSPSCKKRDLGSWMKCAATVLLLSLLPKQAEIRF